jgi:hypothetical protein
VYSYTSDGSSTLLATLPQSSTSYLYTIPGSLPAQTVFTLGVQSYTTTVVGSITNTTFSSVVITSKTLGAAPTVNYVGKSSDSQGNTTVQFSVNNNYSDLITGSILLFVVPDASANPGVNPVIQVPVDNTQNLVVYTVPLGYPALIGISNIPAMLVSAVNSVGTGYYAQNLAT